MTAASAPTLQPSAQSLEEHSDDGLYNISDVERDAEQEQHRRAARDQQREDRLTENRRQTPQRKRNRITTSGDGNETSSQEDSEDNRVNKETGPVDRFTFNKIMQKKNVQLFIKRSELSGANREKRALDKEVAQLESQVFDQEERIKELEEALTRAKERIISAEMAATRDRVTAA